jgi:hypothetical protein
VRAYGVRYGLQLYSDFTFFLHDSINGDGIEQTDQRWVVGADGRYARATRIFGVNGRVTAGAGVRSDFADVGLFHQENRLRLGTRLDDAISQQQTFAWLRQDLALSDRVRLELGLRGDVFRFGVSDRLAAANGVATPSAARWEGLLSPKANLAIAPHTMLFLNAGLGFHSNDARDVVAAPRGSVAVPRAFGSEVGARRFWSGGSVAAALWLMDLQSELVYNGDEDTTEPSGRTRRYGLDLEGRVRLAGWLWADADLNLSHGRFRDAPAGLDLIPLAPTVTSTGGLTVRALGPLEGGVRYRYVGSRAADSSNSIVAKGYILGEVFATWHAGRVDLVFTLDNLLDATWNEAQFATTSRLRGEPSPITELNFTPGAPRSVQLGARYRY